MTVSTQKYTDGEWFVKHVSPEGVMFTNYFDTEFEADQFAADVWNPIRVGRRDAPEEPCGE